MRKRYSKYPNYPPSFSHRTGTAWLNVRTGAGTDKPVLGRLLPGAQAVCYGYCTGGWLLVASRTLTGYVSAAYLRAEAVPAVDGSKRQER